MPQYVEGLNADATLGSVFTDLYGQIDTVVAELDDARRGAYGERKERKNVPETQLELGWLNMPGEDRAQYCAIVVFAADPQDSTGHRLPLISRTEHKMPPQYGPRPESAGAYRQREALPDYTVAQEEPGGVITCSIGRMGIAGSKARDRRLVGTTVGRPNARLDSFADKDIERVKTATSRLARNLGIVERMTIGMSLQEAMREADEALAV